MKLNFNFRFLSCDVRRKHFVFYSRRHFSWFDALHCAPSLLISVDAASFSLNFQIQHSHTPKHVLTSSVRCFRLRCSALWRNVKGVSARNQMEITAKIQFVCRKCYFLYNLSDVWWCAIASKTDKKICNSEFSMCFFDSSNSRLMIYFRRINSIKCKNDFYHGRFFTNDNPPFGRIAIEESLIFNWRTEKPKTFET